MIRFLTLALLFATPVTAQEISTARYSCDRGAQVLASYLNPGDRSFAVLTFEGRQMVFEVALSASGARYVSRDPAAPFVWWTKGDSAMLLHGEGDAEAMIYSECLAG
ncbi:MliC family protein [Gemmobacter denitrificans]|uniref:MliC family protein n=1 Tax=Gemmobacter denitrificans TaxID=3123040 RepID=A0ABU8BT54_9RHOB